MIMRTKQIVKSVLRGAVRSCREYMRMSGGWTVQDQGVESVICYGIAQSLFNETRKRDVVMELPFSWLKEYSLKKIRKGRPRQEFKGKPRADVVLFNGLGWADAVIEVKRWPSYDSIRHDVSRIRAILRDLEKKRDGTVKLGCVVAIRQRRINSRRWKRTSEVAEKFRVALSNEFPQLSCQVKTKGFAIPPQFGRSFARAYNISGYDAMCFYFTLCSE